MKKVYYPLMFSIFGIGLGICGILRIYLKLYHTDFDTGFYTDTHVVMTIFNILLAGIIIVLLALNRLKTVDNDYPVIRENKGIGFLSILTGATMALFVLEETGWKTFTAHTGTQLAGKAILICGILGLVAAVAFVTSGIKARLTGSEHTNGILMLVPAVWQALSIVLKYNTYITVTTNIDNLLLVLFMTFSAMFMIGNARTICGFARKNGRNYTLPSGLIAAIAGLLLVIPNLAYMFRYWTGNPVSGMGDMESLYILCFSLYALASSVRLRGSIAYV